MAKQTVKVIDRSADLPENYKSAFTKAGVNLNTYGELAFLSQMSSLSPELIAAFNEAEAAGLDKSILSKIV